MDATTRIEMTIRGMDPNRTCAVEPKRMARAVADDLADADLLVPEDACDAITDGLVELFDRQVLAGLLDDARDMEHKGRASKAWGAVADMLWQAYSRKA